MGTARMGTDPATSVVDPWGIAHDVANLGIVDGSVFVTAGAANPTSTICALALRAADHLRRPPRGLPDPRAAAPLRRAAPGRHPGVRRCARRRRAATGPERHRAGPVRRARRRAHPGRETRAACPSASDVGVAAGVLLDRVLAARPDLAPVLRRAPGRTVADAPARLAALAASTGRPRHAVVLAVAGGYYLHPERPGPDRLSGPDRATGVGPRLPGVPGRGPARPACSSAGSAPRGWVAPPDADRDRMRRRRPSPSPHAADQGSRPWPRPRAGRLPGDARHARPRSTRAT